MSIKITIADAAKRYGVTQRTIHRWVNKFDIEQFTDGTYDQKQLDAQLDNQDNPDYMDVDWSRAACKSLPTEFFYKYEERGVAKLIDVDVFRFTCAPCPIWKQCLRYAIRNEDYGVWGGCTTDERRALAKDAHSNTKDKVIQDFSRYGVSYEMINEAIGK